jgi:hypothetical protein
VEKKLISDEKRPKRKMDGKSVMRISLTGESAKILDGWYAQVSLEQSTSRINRTNIVAWMIESKGAKLTEREGNDIRQRYFDPVKAMEAACEQVRKLVANGSEIDLNALIQSKFRTRALCEQKPRKISSGRHRQNSQDQKPSTPQPLQDSQVTN